jgi:hypothetical protein
LNRRHMDFQSIALPTELPHRLPNFYIGVAKIGNPGKIPKYFTSRIRSKI